MTPQQAHELLGLTGGESADKIEQAYKARLSELDASAIDTSIHKIKARRLNLTEAHALLMRRTLGGAVETGNTTGAAPAPPQPFHTPGGLSATKLADLPGAQPFQTGIGIGGNMAQITTLQPGHTLANRFEIKSQIGMGGMGAVYRAHDRNRGEDIAVKVMLPGLIASDVAKQRFLNEAKIAIKLGHQHIVNTYDVQMDGAYLFITMELLEGHTLRQAMEEKKKQRQSWSEEDVLEVVRPLCEALAYAHRYTIHRDIKPENVWINCDGGIKLMDFGIARLMTDSQMTQTSAVMGTAYYMAPEQLTGAKHVDHRADQYSVGVMLYELLTERVPTGRFKPVSQIRDDISQGLSDAIDQALAGHPEDRYPDMAAFAQELEQGGKIRKKGANKSARQGAGKKRNDTDKRSMLIWAGAGLGVVALALGGYFYLGSKPMETAAPAATEAKTQKKKSADERQRQQVASAPKKAAAKSPAMVRIPGKNYEIGKYEITQAEWRAVMGNNPSRFTNCGSTCPVEQVSWNDIQEFIQKLNAKTGKQYRLPTDAEWEYACYGDSQSEYCGGNNIDSTAWYGGNSGNTTHPVGQKQANDYGLHDMTGNVWEWTHDCWRGDCAKRIFRGGAWDNGTQLKRASSRGGFEPAIRSGNFGFRLARTLVPETNNEGAAQTKMGQANSGSTSDKAPKHKSVASAQVNIEANQQTRFSGGLFATLSETSVQAGAEGQMPDLAKRMNCAACHSLNKRVVGPAWRDVANKYRGVAGAEDRLVVKVSKGGAGSWGTMPMPANDAAGDKQADIRGLVRFILSL